MSEKKNSRQEEEGCDTKDLLDGIHYTGDKGPCFGARHSIVLLMALGTSLSVATKTSFSVVLVAMTKANASSNPDIPTYDWDNKGTILSSASWLGIPIQLLAGYMAKKYGHKWFALLANLINHTFFLLIPIFATFGGSAGVMFCRIISGGGFGAIFPLAATINGIWVPPEERSKMSMIPIGLIFFLLMITNFASGQIVASYIGYPGFCYIIGSLGLLWCVAWYFLAHQSPATHPRITPEERNYIETTLSVNKTQHLAIPWMKLLTSVNFWAPVVGIIGTVWIDNVFATTNQLYVVNAWELDIKTSTNALSFTSLAGMAMGVIFAPLSDFLIKKKYLRTVNARRIFQTFGIIGSAITLLWMTWIPPKTLGLIVTNSCVASIFSIFFNVGGAGLNILDIAPTFAGIISGCANIFAQTIGLFAPLLIDWIVKDESDPAQWRIMFYITAGICVGTAIFFDLFATDKRQWENLNEPDEQNTENKEEKKWMDYEENRINGKTRF